MACGRSAVELGYRRRHGHRCRGGGRRRGMRLDAAALRHGRHGGGGRRRRRSLRCHAPRRVRRDSAMRLSSPIGWVAEVAVCDQCDEAETTLRQARRRQAASAGCCAHVCESAAAHCERQHEQQDGVPVEKAVQKACLGGLALGGRFFRGQPFFRRDSRGQSDAHALGQGLAWRGQVCPGGKKGAGFLGGEAPDRPVLNVCEACFELTVVSAAPPPLPWRQLALAQCGWFSTCWTGLQSPS